MADDRSRDDVIALRDAATAALRDGRDDDARTGFHASAELADRVLTAGDPDRLALAGAHAQAWFEHWNDAERAFAIAGAAYDAAVEDIDGTHGERRREALRQLGALRDQMTFWAFTMDVR